MQNIPFPKTWHKESKMPFRRPISCKNAVSLGQLNAELFFLELTKWQERLECACGAQFTAEAILLLGENNGRLIFGCPSCKAGPEHIWGAE